MVSSCGKPKTETDTDFWKTDEKTDTDPALACAAVRNVDCWWSADEDVKWCRLMRWRSCEDIGWRSSSMNLIASADITWTRFAVRQVATDGVSESGSRDHVDQDAQQDWLRAAAFWTHCNGAGAMVDLGRPAERNYRNTVIRKSAPGCPVSIVYAYVSLIRFCVAVIQCLLLTNKLIAWLNLIPWKA